MWDYPSLAAVRPQVSALRSCSNSDQTKTLGAAKSHSGRVHPSLTHALLSLDGGLASASASPSLGCGGGRFVERVTLREQASVCKPRCSCVSSSRTNAVTCIAAEPRKQDKSSADPHLLAMLTFGERCTIDGAEMPGRVHPGKYDKSRANIVYTQRGVLS